MNTLEIEKLFLEISVLVNIFCVFPIDQLPEVSDKPACFVINTGPNDKPDEHWVALFCDKCVEYFDSYGLDPLEAFNVNQPDVINRQCLQNFYSIVCGKYCINFLHERSRGVPFEIIIKKQLKRSNAQQFVKAYVDKIRITRMPFGCQSCVCRNEGCQYGTVRKVF